MGVPRLFPYIKKNVPSAITQIIEGVNNENIDFLYIDGNALIHPLAADVFNYGSKPRMIDPYKDLKYQDKLKILFSKFNEKIFDIAKIIKPRKVLYIAMDGSAPLAKQQQQRQRRFISAMHYDPSSFNTASISPGTKFMFELERYMNYSIRKNLNEEEWKHLNIIFSPSNVPGEGEHKAIDFIRKLTKEQREYYSHCLVGCDADLIMLCLTTYLNKVFLLRENYNSVGSYSYVDMGIVRKELPRILYTQNRIKMNIPNRTLNEATDDFVLIGFFVGNDFLPRIQMFLYLEDGLDLMIKKYSESGIFITNNNKINIKNFTKFVESFAEKENEYLINQLSKDIESSLLENKTLKKHIFIGEKDGNGRTIKQLDFDSYRNEYYLKDGIDTEKKIRKLCEEYLKTILFVYKYYTRGLPSWKYFYPYHIPPLMSDFVKYLKTINAEYFLKLNEFQISTPSDPFIQLLSILPPQYNELLPKKLRGVMTSPNSPLVQKGYYPMAFDIDYEGKLKEHEGVAMLNFVDRNEIKKVYNLIQLKKRYRNSLGKEKVYMYNSKYVSTFKSKYGIILYTHVQKK